MLLSSQFEVANAECNVCRGRKVFKDPALVCMFSFRRLPCPTKRLAHAHRAPSSQVSDPTGLSFAPRTKKVEKAREKKAEKKAEKAKK